MAKKILYLVSENTTSSIPLEVAGLIQRTRPDLDFTIAVFYGVPAGDVEAKFVRDVKDLGLATAGFWPTLRKTWAFLKAEKPDVLHVHHNFSAFLPMLLVKVMGRKAYLVKTEHNFHKHYKWYQKVLTVPIFMMADSILCNSDATRHSFYPWEKWLSKGRAKTVYNGIDIGKITRWDTPDNRAAMRAKYGLADDERLFVCVGRLVRQKNYPTLLRAFAQAAQQGQRIRLLVAGDGAQRALLEGLIEELGASAHIRLLGMIDRDEVFRLVNAADYFVILSLWEGFCNAAVEAMVARCPMLCSDIETLREVVGEDVAWYVPPTDVAAVEAAIVKMASASPAELAALSAKSYERAIQNFAIERTAEAYVREYLQA